MDNTIDAKAVLTSKRIRNAKLGLLVALFTGISNGFGGSVTDIASGMWPLSDPNYGVMLVIIAAYISAGLSDFFAGCWIFIWNKASRRPFAEYIRVLKTKIGLLLIVGGFLGGPLATGGFMAAIYLCGPTYALALSGLYPVVGTLASRITLKEKLPGRVWLGIIIVVIGAFIISYSPPDGEVRPYFAVGVAFAFLAAFGWGVEGSVVSYAGDMVDPNIAAGIWRTWGSGIFQLAIVLPLLSIFSGDIMRGWNILGQAINVGTPVAVMAIAGLGTGGAIYYFYQALNMCGIGRTMSFSATSSLWSIIWCLIFQAFGWLTFEVTGMAIAGSFILVAGVLLCISNPKDLIRLR